MIEILIVRDQMGHITEFTITGHAGYDDLGKDIVCAGVSAISGAAIIGMERLLEIEPSIKVEKGYLKCILPDNISEGNAEGARIIVETMALGLKDISDKYKKFVKVLDKEV